MSGNDSVFNVIDQSLLSLFKDFTIDLFLRQEWIDKRLDHSLNRTITVNRGVWKNIWIPDTYFVNAKMGKLHRVSAPNVMLKLGPGGLVKYNTRYHYFTS